MKRESQSGGVQGMVQKTLQQAYQQAPWRKATRKGVLFLILAFLSVIVVWISLTISVESAEAAIEISRLENEKEILQYKIASLNTEIAAQSSASVMEERAIKLGYRPAKVEEIVYMTVPAYPGRQTVLNVPPPPSSQKDSILIKSSYQQSLSDWLFQGLSQFDPFPKGAAP